MFLFSFINTLFAECPEVVWPTSEWPDISDEILLEKSDEIQNLQDYAFTLDGKDSERKGIRTDGMLIIQDGQILFEDYGRGFTRKNPHLLWSITKSINSTLLAIGVKNELISLEESICVYDQSIPDKNCNITVLDLLRFSSGLDFKETYEGEPYQQSAVLAMLYGVGSDDMASFVANHDQNTQPGTQINYSTGDATLLASIIGSAVKDTYGEHYPWTMLFEPLGMSSAVYERDISGTYVGGSYAYLTTHDAARFGYLYLNNGCWNGEQLLPEYWAEQAAQLSQPLLDGGNIGEDTDGSGWSWWLNIDAPNLEIKPWLPDAPSDTFSANGHWGQHIFIVPSWNLIVVRFGDDRDDTHDKNKLLSLAMAIATAPSESSTSSPAPTEDFIEENFDTSIKINPNAPKPENPSKTKSTFVPQ